MDREKWNEIYDIARYNGVAVHQLLNEVHTEFPQADELDIYNACIQWSKNRTKYPTTDLIGK